jgi:voltage-gated potassium channel
MNEYWDILIAALTVISLIILLLTLVNPMDPRAFPGIYIFDIVVTIFLAIDFYLRVKASPNKLRFMIAHCYEFPAMVPLIVFAGLDILTATSSSILSFKLITFSRLIRLYDLVRYIRGNEIFLLTGMAAVTIIFGAFGTYIAESHNKDANITTLGNAFWYAIETITTVAYGEYYPVTPLGKVISTILMLAAIGIVWSVVGIIGSNMVAKRIKQTQTGLLDETKSVIKNRIDEVEKLTDEELEMLIAMIRSLNNRKSQK